MRENLRRLGHDMSPDPARDVVAGTRGRVRVNRATENSPLANLASGTISFIDDDEIADWTLVYEETVYVLKGTLQLVLSTGEVFEGCAGAMFALEEGATVTYRGVAGTEFVYSLWPRDWRESLA